MTGIHQALAASTMGPPTLKLIDIITYINATASLNVCLDVGDSNSYSGTGQQWSDVSGSGNHYYRGSTSGADATDPTFVGSAGDLSNSTYWSFDGGDYFTPTAAQTFADTWHQNNGACTGLFLFYPGTSGQIALWGNATAEDPTAGGTVFRTLNTQKLTFAHAVTNSTSAQETGSVSTQHTVTAWNFLAYSFNEATPNTQIFGNGTNEAIATTTSTATTTGSAAPQISGFGGTSTTRNFNAGSRLIGLALWSRALSTSELQLIYSYLQQRIAGLI